MLDNFTEAQLADASKSLRQRWGQSKKFLLESSGNITESNLAARAIDGELCILACTGGLFD